MSDFFPYDIECYPNFFSIVVTRESDGVTWEYEISEWHNQGLLIMQLLAYIYHAQGRMVGYNNMGYDWPMMDLIWQAEGHVTNEQLYTKSQSIISSFNTWENVIWQPEIPQVDLFKIHHFDNKAKMTSLKLLEFNMRMGDIQELPYDPRYPVTYEQSRHLLRYNHHDVKATREFLQHSLPMIAFRDKLTAKHGKDFTNANDTKIGKDYFLMELDKAGIKTGKHIQTHRSNIPLKDIILPYVQFKNAEFNRVLDILRNTVVVNTKNFLRESAVVDGFSYDFGTGGIHGCVKPQVFRTNDTHMIIDIDYKSYYPNLSIRNKIYPEHLTEKFCGTYEEMYDQRVSYASGSPENKMLKLALNGTYGASNDPHSPFFDPKFTMAITINGQLLLCMLSELLMNIPDFKMIFVNTDGICCYIPKQYEQYLYELCAYSDKHTGLTLEFQKYRMLAIRDCNNYIGVLDD